MGARGSGGRPWKKKSAAIRERHSAVSLTVPGPALAGYRDEGRRSQYGSAAPSASWRYARAGQGLTVRLNADWVNAWSASSWTATTLYDQPALVRGSTVSE